MKLKLKLNCSYALVLGLCDKQGHVDVQWYFSVVSKIVTSVLIILLETQGCRKLHCASVNGKKAKEGLDGWCELEK